MQHRQTMPSRWLIADERLGDRLWRAAERLPAGSGIIVLHHRAPARERSRLLVRLRRIARRRKLLLLDEADGQAARVHDAREIRAARLRGARFLLVSPLFATRSHPGIRPLPRMRAAALARLAGKPIALGGLGERRFRRVRPLGFKGWAGIDAWLEGRKARSRRL